MHVYYTPGNKLTCAPDALCDYWIKIEANITSASQASHLSVQFLTSGNTLLKVKSYLTLIHDFDNLPLVNKDVAKLALERAVVGEIYMLSSIRATDQP